MKSGFHRLHDLRMQNDAVKFHMEHEAARFERIAGRHENGTAPRAVSAYNLFQTPPGTAKAMASLLYLEPGARILEPSAGLGNLVDAVLRYDPAEVAAVEINPTCCGELFRKYDTNVKILQRDFLAYRPGAFPFLGNFDAVIMNPPFHLRADISHILYARYFLKPGGRLVAICMDEPNRRDGLAFADEWITLPEETFRETGTRVKTAVLTWRRPL